MTMDRVSSQAMQCTNGISPTAILDSHALHIILWIASCIAIVGNIFVLLWRLSRSRPQRYSIGSLLVIILAILYLAYGCHEMLLEVSLLCPVFDDCHVTGGNSTLCGLCDTSYWISACSSLMSVWTTLGIIIYAFTFTARFNIQRIHSVLIWTFTVGNGICVCLIMIPAMASRFYDYEIIEDCCRCREQEMTNRQELVTLLVTQCTSSMTTVVPQSIPAVVAFLSIVFLTLCTIVATAVICRSCNAAAHSSSAQPFTPTHQFDHEKFHICFVIVGLLNLLCWWPSLLLHALYILGTVQSSSNLAVINLVAMAIPPVLFPFICMLHTRIMRCQCHVLAQNRGFLLLADNEQQCGRCCCFVCSCRQDR